MTLAAIVLAGGRATRLGGADKPALEVRGRSLLSIAVDAAEAAGCAPIVAVGPARDEPRVTWVHEDPPFAGPAWAVRAALPLVAADRVLLLAADLPRAGEAVAALLAAGLEEAVLVDADGRQQWLTGVYRTVSLRDGAAAIAEGASMRSLLAHTTPTLVSADPAVLVDIDTWEDLHSTRARLEERS